jgi:hypothetical protein
MESLLSFESGALSDVTTMPVVLPVFLLMATLGTGGIDASQRSQRGKVPAVCRRFADCRRAGSCRSLRDVAEKGM